MRGKDMREGDDVTDPVADLERHLMAVGWPPALAKAAWDPFDYAARVYGLGVLKFERAVPVGDGRVWLVLHGVQGVDRLPFLFDRGVCVRLDEVRWVADAPDGS